MKRKKHVLWALLVVFALTVISGGCGGGGGGGSGGGGGGDPIYDIDIDALNGDWEPNSGSGTASGDGYDFRVQLNDPPGLITFRVLSVTEEDAAVEIDSAIKWDFYYQNQFYTDVPLGLADKEKILIQFIGKGAFQFRSVDGTTFRAQFTSDTALYIEEMGSFEIENPEISTETIKGSYRVRYSLIKEVEEDDDEDEE